MNERADSDDNERYNTYNTHCDVTASKQPLVNVIASIMSFQCIFDA
jgi:hypothetical protein